MGTDPRAAGLAAGRRARRRRDTLLGATLSALPQTHAPAGHAAALTTDAMNRRPSHSNAAARRNSTRANAAVLSPAKPRAENRVARRTRANGSAPWRARRSRTRAIHGSARREKSPVTPAPRHRGLKSNLQGSGPGKEMTR